ncbi:hypothetical protein ACQBAU_18430 [Propionibacteriaceae bacterium Y2011]
MTVMLIVTACIFVPFTAVGVIAGWPAFGLWVAGFIPFGYAIWQFIRARWQRALVTLGAGLGAGVVGLGSLAVSPSVTQPDMAAVPVPAAAVSHSTSSSAPTSPSPSTATSAAVSSTRPASPTPAASLPPSTRQTEAPQV